MPFPRLLSGKERQMSQAVAAARTKRWPERHVAREYGVNRQTLRNRLAGMEAQEDAHRMEQRLTPEQEDFLVEWILEQDECGCAPSHERVRELATKILVNS